MKDKYKLIILVMAFVITLLIIKMYVDKSASGTGTSSLNSSTEVSKGMVTELTDDNFDSFIKGTDEKVLVDFYATWCGPCQMLIPIIDEMASENRDVLFVRVDVDACPKLSDRYRIQSMPTLVVIQDGKEINRSLGLKDKEAILDLIK